MLKTTKKGKVCGDLIVAIKKSPCNLVYDMLKNKKRLIGNSILSFFVLSLVFSLFGFASRVDAAKHKRNVKIKTVSSEKVGEFEVKWEKVKCDGYQLEYKLKYDYKPECLKRINLSNKLNRKAIKKIYDPEEVIYSYARVRSYIKSGNKRIYSKWSPKKVFEIKKPVYENEPEFGHVVTKKKECGDWEYHRLSFKIVCEEYETNDNGEVMQASYSAPAVLSSLSPELMKNEDIVSDILGEILNEVTGNETNKYGFSCPKEAGKYEEYEIYIYLGCGK